MTSLSQIKGDVIDWVAGSNLNPDDVVTVRAGTSGCIGIVVDTILSGATGPVRIQGIVDLVSDTGTAWAIGDLIYWTGTTLTKTSTGNVLAGMCVLLKASGTAKGRIKLRGM